MPEKNLQGKNIQQYKLKYTQMGGRSLFITNISAYSFNYNYNALLSQISLYRVVSLDLDVTPI